MIARSPGRDWIEATAIAAGLSTLYAFGASPTAYVGDSGELVAAVATLGIPHPSGYPLYVLLGHLWTNLLHVGSIAYRMSLFSAAAGAAASGALYVLARRLGLERASALLASLLLALGPVFWSQANIQRVYTLNALFVVLATLAVARWLETRGRHATQTPLLAFFLCGLGASNHTVMAIYAVALGAVVVAVEPSLLRAPFVLLRRAAAAAATFLLGLLPYLYLPIRSRMDPRLDWGDPETLDGVLGVVLRRDFWERAWLESPADLVTITADYLHGIANELAWAGAVLALVGVVACWRRHRPIAVLALLLMLGNVTTMAMHGSRSDIFIWHRYYIPSYVMAALFAGFGWQLVVEHAPRPARWAALVLPAVLLATGYRDFDRSRYRIAEDFAYAVLESLPPGAHLIATDDNVLFVLIYLHLAEQRRPDIDLILQGVGKADLQPLRFDPDDDPLYFTHHPNWDLPELEVVPVGVVYRAWRRGRPDPPIVLPRSELDGEHDPRVPKDYLTRNLIGHFHYTLGFTFERRDWPRAREEFGKAALVADENDVLFYNLGLVFARNGLYDEARAAFARSHEINPRHLASVSKPRAADKMREVEAERMRIATVETRLSAQSEMPPAGTHGYHLGVAELLESAGEALAAHGHRLRASELAQRS